MVTACGASEAALLSVGTDQRPKLQEQAGRWGLQTIVAAMQLMAETKARMQRVTYGRALAELALVRISMLEDLDRLDEVVARLSGGTGSSLPSTGSSRPSGSPAVSPPVEKKNDIAPARPAEIAQPAIESAIPSESSSAAVQPSIADEQPLIEWKPGCEKELHAAILSRLTDMTGTHLGRVCRTAISGPIQLDFFFPANYHLDRRQCDRPDVVNRLEQIIAGLVGRQIRVRFQVTEAIAGESAKVIPVAATGSAKIGPAKTKFVEMPDDPYLQDVMNVFGIKVWKVQPQASETDASGGEG